MTVPAIRGLTQPAISNLGAVTSPASTQIGDYVLIFVWSQGVLAPNAPLHITNTGYTSVISHAHDDGTTDGRMSVSRIVATSAGAVSYTPYTISGATVNQTCAGIVVLTGESMGADTFSSTNASATSTSNAPPNPPQVTGLTGDYLVLAIGAWHVTSAGSTASSPPTGYTEQLDAPAGSHVTHLAVATLAIDNASSAAPNPGAFTDNVTPNGTVGMTVAVKGAADRTATIATTSSAQTDAATGTVEVTGTIATTSSAQTDAATGTVETVEVEIPHVRARSIPLPAVGPTTHRGSVHVTAELRSAVVVRAALIASVTVHARVL